MARIILHDRRVMGRAEAGLGDVIQVDENTPIREAFAKVAAAVPNSSNMSTTMSSPTELVIVCHGYMSHEYDRRSNPTTRGGYGLELCRETLQMSNIAEVRALKNLFTTIWLMACGIAGNLLDNSRPFCREFAHYANTVVIAGEREQSYNPGTYDSVRRATLPVLRFGAWEGRVFQFFPDGTARDFFGRQNETPLP